MLVVNFKTTILVKVTSVIDGFNYDIITDIDEEATADTMSGIDSLVLSELIINIIIVNAEHSIGDAIIAP